MYDDESKEIMDTIIHTDPRILLLMELNAWSKLLADKIEDLKSSLLFKGNLLFVLFQ